ncbi:hypothetical protein FLM48_08600 [Shewanella sp. Scap07]|uniref:LON peptidase substrate-binding domain-containing protein n=1 Tax=Shewanella sp. Scap07 TaxID=2589987 RepID=UPI0015B91763|nr:LON peptidase substrate-binding domain-containing protein [Shewanella sp. Scap07]QLE85143.1 hypothetical protein FLM48_08600 [Shewanella sp. Scap07]
MVVENLSNSSSVANQHSQHRECTRLSVFPLPLFLLPGAVSHLRIFEAKYLDMVTASYKEGGFVIARYDKDFAFNVPKWGCHVEIVDFHTSEDNVLVIEVRAKKLVALNDFNYRDNGLLSAMATTLPNWAPRHHNDITDEFALFLAEIYERQPALQQLHDALHLDDPIWVCARILEIIPLSLIEKEKFIGENEFDNLVCFLQTLILGQVNKN